MNNPHAFPSPAHTHDDGSGAVNYAAQSGMTLRDYFAAKALISIIPNEGWIEAHVKKCAADAASQAYEIADAMLAEREGRAA